ncbi:serine protease inhibitor Kazal-type 1 [Drosophila biarmipes]|uniref:serine protease inhibitor Kazal-type 1 n=1 Tax=Drosophila biarmipes TaxID=125945 RepID=UPI0007E67989|nr:serine protease inhibitor Kazal-type 1 [Drosophila biarmipes]
MRCLALIALCLLALLVLAAGQESKGFCPCPRNYDPVCGSDSVTYSNQCDLNCAAKNQGRAITVVKAGKC